jgi:hypothetical protein
VDKLASRLLPGARPRYGNFMALVEFDPQVSGFVRPELEADAINIERVAAAAHYVIANTDPGKLGHVKLNKILWYSDLEHYRWHGISVTGLQQYTRTPQGPMSQEIAKAVRRLVKDGKVAEPTIKVADFPRRELVGLEQPDGSSFTDRQSGILNEMIKVIAPLTAVQLNELTYGDPLWKEVKNGEAMLIATGSIVSRPPQSA